MLPQTKAAREMNSLRCQSACEGRPEALTLRKGHKRGGQRPKDQAECQYRNAEPNEAIKYELPVSFSIKRSGREVPGQQEEEAHKVGLVGRAEENKQDAGGGTGRLKLMPEPTADGAISDCCVMQDDQDGHHTAQAVDVELPLGDARLRCRALSGFNGCGVRASRHEP